MFDTALNLAVLDKPGNTFRWMPEAKWYQGNGVYGGLVFAVICEAIGRTQTRRLRRLSVELCRAVVDVPTTITVNLEHESKRCAFLSFRMVQNETTCAVGTAMCGEPRSCDLDMRDVRELPKLNQTALNADLLPPYARYFHFYPCSGIFPLSGHAGTGPLLTGGWISPIAECQRDLTLCMALVDAWWPAMLGRCRTMRPMGTTSFAVDILMGPCSDPGPFYFEAESEGIVDGFETERNRLWDHEGNLLCVARQNVTLIR